MKTDHRPLLSFYGSKKGIPIYITNKLQHWGTILRNNDFKREHLPSKEFGQVDSLLRLIAKYSEPLEDTVKAALKAESEIENTLCNVVCGSVRSEETNKKNTSGWA